MTNRQDSNPIKRKSVVCPRCRKAAVELIEVYRDAAIYFCTDDSGLWDGRDGVLEPPETISHVEARCACGHQWRLRGVGQVTDLIKSY